MKQCCTPANKTKTDMNNLFESILAEKIAETGWEIYQAMLDAHEVEPSTDPELMFKRGVLSAVAAFTAFIDGERQVMREASKN